MSVKSKLKQLHRYFFKKSESINLTPARQVGFRKPQQIRADIAAYAKKNDRTLVYRQRDMPIRFTLDGVPYQVKRGWGRGGPVVSAAREYEDD